MGDSYLIPYGRIKYLNSKLIPEEKVSGCSMNTRVKEEQKVPLVDNGCKHHWIIEPANGATSMGVCKVCQAEMEFYNSWISSVHTVNTHLFDLPPRVDVDIEIGKVNP